ncbi:MAG: YfhO family protein [Chloroflexi bacterium]|nr:YfhO family protein [Chloroflexota bacterium]
MSPSDATDTAPRSSSSALYVLRFLPSAFLALVCALPCANVWLGPGIIHTHAGGDSPFLLQRVFELATNLRAGVFPVRWMPDAAFGLGYPFFNYYASLPYYLAALLNLAGFDLIASIKLTQSAGMFAAAAAMFLFARTLLPGRGALLAAVAYTLAPYHLVNIYVRGDSLVEFFAFVWYPLILWGVDRVTVARRHSAGLGHETVAHSLISVVLLACAVAALVLTHNVSTLLFAPFIVLYALLRLVQHWRQTPAGDRCSRRERVGPWLGLATAALLAAALSAWFWLPALGEAGAVQLGDQTTGYFNYSNHFRAGNLVQSALLFDYHVDSSLDVFAMALPQAVLIVAGAMAWLAFGKKRISAVIVLVLFLLSTLMITPLSQFVWDATPLLPLAQFPWRFLSVQALFGSLLAGGFIYAGEWASAKWRLGQWGTPAVLAVACGALLLTLPGLPNDRLDVRAEDITPQTLQFYEWFSGNIGTTIRAEYLPGAVQPRPAVGPDLAQQPRRALAVAGSVISSELVQQEPIRQVWHITVSGAGATMALPLLYWPGWLATDEVDGTTRQIELSPYPGSGWVMMWLPGGEHRVTLWLAGTALQRQSDGVALAALIILVALTVVALAMARVSLRRVGRWTAVVVATVLAVVMIAQASLRLDQESVPALQTAGYLDHQFPNRAPLVFQDGDGQRYELTGVRLMPASVRAGEPFTLTTTWRDGRAPAQVGIQQELPSGGYFAYLFRFARSVSYGPPELSVHTALTDALPGPLLLKLLARDVAGNVLTPTTPSGQALERNFLTGLTVVAAAPAGSDAAVEIPIRTFPNGIVLHAFDWYLPNGQDICFRPTWASSRPLAGALQVSFLLRGADGREIARADTQPQAGLAPTWSWPIGALVRDSYCVPVSGTLTSNEPYTLLVRWYRVLDQHATGEVTLVGDRANVTVNAPNIPHPIITAHQYDIPMMQQRTDVRFTLPGTPAGDIRLLGYSLVTSTQALSVTLYWSANLTVVQDYKSFVHYAPLSTPEPVRQADRFTRDGMYPTGMWLPGEVVSDTVRLDLADVPSGDYQLAVGWYDPDTLIRLPAEVGGTAVPDGRYVVVQVKR